MARSLHRPIPPDGLTPHIPALHAQAVLRQQDARPSDNARSHGLRAIDGRPADDRDDARLQALEHSVEQRLRPGCLLEAAVCARVAVALWQAERADRLEQEYWEQGGCRLDDAEAYPLIATLQAEGSGGPRTLATVVRYQTAARNALSRALRDLERLRSGKLLPADDTNEPKQHPAGALGISTLDDDVPCLAPPDYTNEPDAHPASGRAGLPDLPSVRALLQRHRTNETEETGKPAPSLLNRRQRRRIEALLR